MILFRILLGTHSVGLDDIALKRAVVVLRIADGKEVVPRAVEEPLGSVWLTTEEPVRRLEGICKRHTS